MHRPDELGEALRASGRDIETMSTAGTSRTNCAWANVVAAMTDRPFTDWIRCQGRGVRYERLPVLEEDHWRNEIWQMSGAAAAVPSHDECGAAGARRAALALLADPPRRH